MKELNAIYKMWDGLYGSDLPCKVCCTKVFDADKKTTYVVIVDSPEGNDPSRRFIATDSSMDNALSDVISQMQMEVTRVRDLLTYLAHEFGG